MSTLDLSTLDFALILHLLRGALATAAVVLAAGSIARWLQMDSPRLQRWIYVAALIMPLLSPLAMFPLRIAVYNQPPATRTAPAPHTADVLTSGKITLASVPASRSALPETGAAAAVPPAVVQPSAGWQWTEVLPQLANGLTLIWLAGVFLFPAGSLISYGVFVRRLYADRLLSDRPCHSDWSRQWSGLLAEAGVKHEIPLWITSSTGPCLIRLPRGYVLAAPAETWRLYSGLQREVILRHELSHLIRGDIWKDAMLRLLAAVQWFNPAAWFALRQFGQCGEWLSDADAARTQSQRIQLARALTEVASLAQRRRPALAMEAAGHPLSQRVQRLLGSHVYKVSQMKKFLIIGFVALVAATQTVRLELAAEEKAPATVEGVKQTVIEFAADIEKLKTAVEGLKARGEALKQKVETRLEELKTLAANPQGFSKPSLERLELIKTGDKTKQLEALKDAASQGDEGLIVIAYAARSSAHTEVRQEALTIAASMKEKGLPVLAFSLDSVSNKELIHLAGEIEKHKMADRILLYKALIKDADSDLQDAVLKAGAKLQQRALFIGSLAEKADAALLGKMLKIVEGMEGRDGLLLLFAAAGAKDADVAVEAVNAAAKRGAAGLPVLIPAAKTKDVKVRYAVVKAASSIGGEAGDYIVERCLEASEDELRTAAESAVKDSNKQ